MTFLDLLYLLSLAFAMVISFLKLYRVKAYSMIPWMLLFMLIFFLVAALMKAQDQNNLFLFHIWTPVEYSFLGAIYYRNVTAIAIKRYIIWSVLAVLITSLYLVCYVEGPTQNNFYAGILCIPLTISLALLYLYQLVSFSQIAKFQSDPLCWISVGLLFSASVNLGTQLPYNYSAMNDWNIAKWVYGFAYSHALLYFISIIAAAIFSEKDKYAGDSL